jgi:exodeoxyribonuclease V beta subunit
MTVFNILSRAQPIHRNFLLEASAGTGKTFSIEHLCVRLLLEPGPEGSPLELEDLLVVTFTRAATRELFQRIRECLEAAVDCLTERLDEAPDYLQALFEEGEDACLAARKRLEHALYAFDAIQVQTIHGFCARSLGECAWEHGLGTVLAQAESGDPDAERRLLLDFLRSELDSELITAAQWGRLIQSRRASVEAVLAELQRLMSGRFAVEGGARAVQLRSGLRKALGALRRAGVSGDRVQGAFRHLAPHFKGVSVSGRIVESASRSAQCLADALEREEWPDAILDELFADALDPFQRFVNGQKFAKAPEEFEASAREFIELYSSQLFPLIRQATDPAKILATVAEALQQFRDRMTYERACAGPDQLLQQMAQAVQRPEVAAALQKRFRAAIVDEFQDTDPVQWDVFQRLFLDEGWKGHLYLVGDPKQAIYRFRSADIYTYLAAGQALGEDGRASLGTNYRSHPALVSALNRLFSPDICASWIRLPRTEAQLSYDPVQSGAKVAERDWGDTRERVHFFFGRGALSRQGATWPNAETQLQLNRFVAQEIQRLHAVAGVAYRDQAVLVRDHTQAAEVLAILASQQIPAMARRGGSLCASPAYPAVQDLILSLLSPRSLSRIKVLLGGNFLAFSAAEILELEAEGALVHTVQAVLRIRRVYEDKGIAAAWLAFCDLELGSGGQTVQASLLALPQGQELFESAQQMIELLMDYERGQQGLEGLLRYLQSWKQLDSHVHSQLQQRQDPMQDAVQVMTIHVSKGLEFGVVYALGLAKRAVVDKGLIPCHDEGRDVLKALDSESSEAQLSRAESEAERLRHLYVAWTRARERLYIPVAIDEKDKAVPAGTASAIELYIQGFASGQGYEGSIAAQGAYFLEQLEQRGQEWGCSFSEAGDDLPLLDIPSRSDEGQELIRPPQVALQATPTLLRSFTGLAAQPQRWDYDLDPPHAMDADEKHVGSLPAGAPTGVLLHRILEEAPIGSSVDWLDFVQPYVASSAFAGWEQTIASICERCFTHLLPGLGRSVSDLDPRYVWREVDFLYHLPDGMERAKDPSYMRGVVDLLCKLEGRYYLIDWKSNWLGPDWTAYSQAALRQEIERHDYLLQAQIYTEALRRYVALFEEAPFEELFGGIYYVFLRGLNPEDSEQGVYLMEAREVCHGQFA